MMDTVQRTKVLNILVDPKSNISPEQLVRWLKECEGETAVVEKCCARLLARGMVSRVPPLYEQSLRQSTEVAMRRGGKKLGMRMLEVYLRCAHEAEPVSFAGSALTWAVARAEDVESLPPEIRLAYFRGIMDFLWRVRPQANQPEDTRQRAMEYYKRTRRMREMMKGWWKILTQHNCKATALDTFTIITLRRVVACAYVYGERRWLRVAGDDFKKCVAGGKLVCAHSADKGEWGKLVGALHEAVT